MILSFKPGDAFQIAVLGAATAAVFLTAVLSAKVEGAGDVLTGSYQRGYEARFKSEIPLGETVTQAWRAAKLALFSEPDAAAVLGKNGWVFTAEEFEAPKTPVDLAKELEKVAATLETYDIQLLPVIVPDKARMASDQLPYVRSKAFQNRYDGALTAIDVEDLPVVDVRPALASTDNMDTGFLKTDTHWSPEGAQRVANAIASANSVPLAPVSFETKLSETGVLKADLMVFFDTGSFSPNSVPSTEQINTYETIGGGDDLFGDASVDVALVGTSFSARTDLHFAEFLKTALQADVINYAQEGVGPFEPMNTFLSGLKDGSIDSNLKLVIWEIPERYLSIRSTN